jgi:hypothetical protein
VSEGENVKRVKWVKNCVTQKLDKKLKRRRRRMARKKS